MFLSSHCAIYSFSAITVNSSTNSYLLTKLKSKTIYKVSVSAFTTAGEGVRSDQIIFETKQYGTSEGAYFRLQHCTAYWLPKIWIFFNSPEVSRLYIWL